MELKGRRLRSVKRLRSIIVLQLEKARKRITVAVSGGALKMTVRAQVAENLSRSLQNKNLYGEKTILSALCNWLASLMLCVSSFLYGYGHWFYLNWFSALLFWSDGCIWYQTGVFHSLHIRSLKKQSFFLLTNSHILNWGLQKNADGLISNLGDLPREPSYQRWIEYFFG